jgi:hypothetical protein
VGGNINQNKHNNSCFVLAYITAAILARYLDDNNKKAGGAIYQKNL